MKATHIHICNFESTCYVEKPTYRKIKAAALEAGRYSVFEATKSSKFAHWFMRLDKDPEVERFELGYPWIGVRRLKKGQEDEPWEKARAAIKASKDGK